MTPLATILRYLTFAPLLSVSLEGALAMNIAECENNEGFMKVPNMNGFTVYVDSYTANILDLDSESIDEAGSPRTYRECLSYATSEARRRLVTKTIDDAPFLHLLSKIPFKISNGGGGDMDGGVHFAYSGKCDRGCIYSQLPERLIRDIANNPDLFMHEYAHVLHLGTESSAQSRAQEQSYLNFMAHERPDLETIYGQPYVPGSCCFWYAAANKYEFFAVTTQAFFLEDSEQRWDWPKTSALLHSESPAAFDIAEDYWGISEADLLQSMGECTIPSYMLLSEEQGIMIMVGAFILLILFFVFAYFFCNSGCKRCRRKGAANSYKSGMNKQEETQNELL